MRNKIVLIVSVAVIIAVTTTLLLKAQGVKSPSDKPTTVQAKVIYLDRQAFLEKVFNYEKNNAWNYNGKIPAIVDFYADWCAPCRYVAPILDELSGMYSGKIHIYKVNVEKEKQLAQELGVQSLPTILFIPAKGQPSVSMGAMSKEDFIKNIEGLLSQK
jgi:thioredoxin